RRRSTHPDGSEPTVPTGAPRSRCDRCAARRRVHLQRVAVHPTCRLDRLVQEESDVKGRNDLGPIPPVRARAARISHAHRAPPVLALLLAAGACFLVAGAAPVRAQPLDLERLDGPTAIAMMEKGQLTSVRLTKMYIERIEALNKRGPGLNAVTQ